MAETKEMEAIEVLGKVSYKQLFDDAFWCYEAGVFLYGSL